MFVENDASNNFAVVFTLFLLEFLDVGVDFRHFFVDWQLSLGKI
jgi:hypothetical protein